ncbi:ABC transporter ATP-binding protein [Gorillibacterium massiliense]|uniref:ABC transporter ATP-binding protein n=1 Tax=Gorillibacterium massiliense TaxID=1280390 RepID=UPI0004B86275|nr:ATP-binding cassette domain-containing protein [Gorillibacterium massiliense]
MSQIEVSGLTKVFRQAIKQPGLKGAVKHFFTQQYRDKQAVDGINLTIEKGESVAYVGPNGAGKSTTIKMLTGILVPTSGAVRVNGIDPHKKRMENAGKIGAVFGQRTQLWWDIPVAESFSLLKDIYEIPDGVYRENMKTFTKLLELDEYIHLTGRKLSLGQRMRADLAASLLHNPEIVYLDEPTIGLDIAVKERIRKFIKHINAELGTTVMLTTHDLGDIEDLCSRLVIIDHGKIIYDGELQAVKDAFARERTLHFQLGKPASALAHTLHGIPGIISHEADGNQVSVSFDRFAVTAGEVAGQIMKLAEVVDFRIDEPSIETIIRRVYAGELDLAEMATEERGVV